MVLAVLLRKSEIGVKIVKNIIFKRGGVGNRGFRASIGEWSYQEIDLDEIYRLRWSKGGG